MFSSSIKNQAHKYSKGHFEADNDSFLPGEFDKPSPFGSRVASIGNDYTVYMAPDGTGLSFFGNYELTNGKALAKQWAIKDQQTNSTWMPFLYNKDTDHDKYSVKYMPGSVEISSLKNKISSNLTISASPADTCEYWLLNIQNLSATKRNLLIDTRILPYEGICGRIEVSKSGKTISLNTEHSESDSVIYRKSLYLSSTLKPACYHTCTADYATTDQLPHLPDPSPVLGFSIELEVPVEGEACIGFCFGINGRNDDTSRTEKYLSRTYIEKQIRNSREQWRKVLTPVRCKSSDPFFDALINTWLPYELITEWQNVECVNSQYCMADVIDSVRLAAPFSMDFPAQIRRKIYEFCIGMVDAGLYSFDGLTMRVVNPADTLWLPYSVAEYIVQSGDTSILQEEITLRNNKTCSIGEICKRDLSYYIEYQTYNNLALNPIVELPLAVLFPNSPKHPKLSQRTAGNISDLAEYLFTCSSILSKNRAKLCRWLPDAEDQYGQLLGIYLGAAREILDRSVERTAEPQTLAISKRTNRSIAFNIPD